jgi:APA family basic amino acid/polyamine antiporter
MGEDYPLLKNFSMKNKFDMPYVAILAQAGWAIFLVLVSSFKEIIQYISVSLSIFSMFTVLGIFLLRTRHSKEARTYSLPFYPIPPLIFTACTCWMIWYMTKDDPRILLYSCLTMIPGLVLYVVSSKKERNAGQLS